MKTLYLKRFNFENVLSEFKYVLDVMRNFLRSTFYSCENSQGNVISATRYIRNSLYPVCAKSGMGCFIVEEDSLAFFTAQMRCVDCQKGHCQN